MKKIDSSKLEKLNKNELIHYIKNLHDNQDLGLNWEDKEEDVVTNLEQKLPILSEIKKSEIQNEKNNSSNLIIEGDNYYSLLNLNYTHEKKIDVIYIDPPYNTGKEFLYNDNIVDSVDEYRHSKWLSFMSKRLKLAKELLKDNGIIFIAIDDNEQAHLKLLCNEIFDEKNFVGDIVIVNNLKGRNDKLHIALAHERLLIFKKSLFQERGLKLSDEKIKEFDKKDKDGNPIRLLGLRKRGGADTRTSRPNLFFPLYISPKNGFVSTKKTTQSIQVFPKKSDGTDGCWRWGKNSVDLKHDMLLGKRSSTGKWDVFQIDYLHIDGHLRRSKPKSVWAGADYSSDSATKNFRKIMKDSKFTNPKSVELIKDIIDYSTGNESTILDFFAGSGTTGHAVLELNKEDGGNRKFILCTNHENNICTKVCYPRIKKVMNG